MAGTPEAPTPADTKQSLQPVINVNVSPPENKGVTRRGLLIGAATAAGGLVLGDWVRERTGQKERDALQSGLNNCQEDLAANAGEMAGTKQNLAACGGRLELAQGEFQTKIGAKDKEIKILTAENKDLSGQLAQERTAHAKTQQQLLLAGATASLWMAAAKGDPLALRDAFGNALEAIPAGFSDETQNAVTKIKGDFVSQMESVRRLIIPLKEVADKIGNVALPVAQSLDIIVTSFQETGRQIGKPFIERNIDLLKWIRDHAPIGSVREMAQEGITRLTQIKVELETQKGNKFTALQDLVRRLSGQVADMDDLLSKRITNPPLKAVEEAVSGVLSGVEKRIGDWRTDTSEKIARKVADQAKKEAERTELLNFMTGNLPQITAEITRRGIAPTTNNFLKIAKELMNKSRGQ